jgi:large subunit ribosomal protein L3
MSMKALLGYKRGMARVFDTEGRVVPVTVIEAGPCTVTQVRTADRDGYSAVQLGFGAVKPERLPRARLGHLRRSGALALKHLREFRGVEAPELKVGAVVRVDAFAPGDRVDVVGRSRGLGWAGTIKRHHFNRQRKTHGQSDRERAPGSVGAGTSPGRTMKGLRMAGRMGGERVTVRNLTVVVADPERNLLALKGAVPGFDGGLLEIRATTKGAKGGQG